MTYSILITLSLLITFNFVILFFVRYRVIAAFVMIAIGLFLILIGSLIIANREVFQKLTLSVLFYLIIAVIIFYHLKRNSLKKLKISTLIKNLFTEKNNVAQNAVVILIIIFAVCCCIYISTNIAHVTSLVTQQKNNAYNKNCPNADVVKYYMAETNDEKIHYCELSMHLTDRNKTALSAANGPALTLLNYLGMIILISITIISLLFIACCNSSGRFTQTRI